MFPTTLVEIKGQQELRGNWRWIRRRKRKWNGMESSKSKSDANFMHGWDETRGQLKPNDVVVQWVNMTTQDWPKLTRRLRAHSLVRCRVSCALCWSWMSRCHWCRTSKSAVSPRIRNPSFFHVVVRLHLVIVNSNCSHNYCLLHIAKRVNWGVIFAPSVAYSRPL